MIMLHLVGVYVYLYIRLVLNMSGKYSTSVLFYGLQLDPVTFGSFHLSDTFVLVRIARS